jgi:hypothetical protein
LIAKIRRKCHPELVSGSIYSWQSQLQIDAETSSTAVHDNFKQVRQGKTVVDWDFSDVFSLTLHLQN